MGVTIKTAVNELLKMMANIIRLIVLGATLACVASVKAPHWEDLECEAGHKYLFSDQPRTWQDAREECELYGGWLVNIGGVEEQNCLVRYGRSQGYDGWYFTDAYRDDLGVFVHAFDNSDVSWFAYFSCWGTDNGSQDGLSGGDHMQLGIWGTYKR